MIYSTDIENLSVEDQKGFYVGFGSTLRNNKKLEESLDLLKQGIKKFPEYLPLRVFLGFTLHSLGQYEEANRELLSMCRFLPNSVLDGYEAAIAFYARQLNESVKSSSKP
jgi:tetratricopeptide (TPR) repeat protein